MLSCFIYSQRHSGYYSNKPAHDKSNKWARNANISSLHFHFVTKATSHPRGLRGHCLWEWGKHGRAEHCHWGPIGDAANNAQVSCLDCFTKPGLILNFLKNSSPFVGPFLTRVKGWKTTLLGIKEIIAEWLLVQKGWLYLAPIFQSPDIYIL